MNESGEEFTPERNPTLAAETTGPVEGSAGVSPSDSRIAIPQSPARVLPENAPIGNEGWLASVQSLLITITIAIFVITFTVQAFQIPSESMQNTLLIGDYLLVDKAHFGPAGPWSWLIPYQKVRRDDIVVFRYPVDPKQHFVKRVIGTPGDRIRLVNKRVFVNGHLQKEPFVLHIDPAIRSFRDNFPNGDPNMEHLSGAWQQQMRKLTEDGQLIVPDGYFFVMGDNRDDSSDSRYWGFVPRQNIVGRPLLIYWSVRSRDPEDPDEEKPHPDDKLTRFVLAWRQRWQDLRWHRMLTLVR